MTLLCTLGQEHPTMSYEKLTSSSREAQSESPLADHLTALSSLFPSVVREGKADFDALRQLLGDDVAKEGELFGLQWKGKTMARRAASTPSLGTLRPCKEESVNWDTTKNLYLEGDNLEVLKLLRKSYAGKVKMIYIDPPYNTGKEFVYPDNYQNGIEEYKKLTGQQGGFKANVETSGRYHTDWLNMMYPRLALAKDLLSDDGVIFISIDDHECANLVEISNEVFGETNFIAQLVWERAYAPKNDAKFISNSHDYVLMYAKQINKFELGRLERTKEANARYSNPDNDPRGAWKPSDLSVKTYNPSCDYPVETPSGRTVKPPAGRCWRLSKKAFQERLQDGRIWFGVNGDSVPCLKRFLSELKYEGMAPTSLLYYREVGHTQEAAKEVANLLNSSVFEGPKPVRLLKRLLTLAKTDENSVILDFFSGSATTAHSVLQLNSEDGGKRQFIMVQLPEPCEKKSENSEVNFETICDIAKERIRRAGKKVKEEAGLQGQHLDIGFRVYKLDSSNLRVWNPEADNLELALGSHEKHLLPGRTQQDLLYEILLKQGIELTEDASMRELAGKCVYSLGHGQYYACMETAISSDQIEQLAMGISQWKHEESPDNTQCAVFVIDEAFQSDADKLNFTKLLEQHGIPFVKAL